MRVVSRRLVLRTAMATAGMPSLPGLLLRSAWAQAGPQRTRHDVGSADGQSMLRIYADSVGRMMAAAESDPRGWLFQWYTHAVRDDRTKDAELARIYAGSTDPNRALAEAMWDTCEAHFDPSREDFFLPWHRAFVMFMEQIVRSISGNAAFTLPYWNYTDPNNRTLPDQFRMQNDPVWRPLFRAGRNSGINSGRAIDQVGGAPLNLEAMRSPSYQDTGTGDAGFCANLDAGLHGSVHVDIGNPERGMGTVPWAANDPIFWLHHCNIDRVWASWNRAGGSNPSDAGYLNQRFTFVDGAGARTQAAVRDVLDTGALGYVYDRYLDRPAGSVPFTSTRVASSVHAESRSGRIAVGSAGTTVALAAKGTARRLRAVAPNENFFLRLGDVRAAAQPGVAYDVYLNLPQGAAPDRGNPYYVGSTSFFGAVAHGGHAAHSSGAARRSYSFVATATVRRLLETTPSVSAPTVTLVPIGTPRADATLTIGSISLSSS